MGNWNIANSECLQDDCKIESNINIDNKPLVHNGSEEINHEGMNDQGMNDQGMNDEELFEGMRGRRHHIRRPSARIQHIGYGRPRYRKRFFPVLYDRPIVRSSVYSPPVIINREVPVIKKDPEMDFGIEKLVMLLIVLILLVGGGLFLLRKN